MPDLPPESLDTMPKLLRWRARIHGDRGVAMRVKDRGIWKRYTWSEYYKMVRDLSLGMARMGLQRGEKVCILGENKPQWYWAELAAQAAGAVPVGVFTDCIPSEVRYYIEDSQSTIVVAHDQEQVDKVLEIKPTLPRIKKVIYWDPKGLWSYKDPDLVSMDEVMGEGGRVHQGSPSLFDEWVDRGTSGDIAAICYTSGTTGPPKGAMMSQRQLVEGGRAWSQLDGWAGRNFEYLSFIPPAWATEQALGIAGSLVAGMVVNFPEEPETVQENIREIGPHVLFYGARLWENVNRTVQARMIDSTALRRWLYDRCLSLGLRAADSRIQGRPLGPAVRLKGWLAHLVAFRALKDRLGLSRVKVVYSAGGAISPEIIRFFLAMGIEIKLFYGSTEMGVVSVPRTGEIRPETSGRPVPWVEVRISQEGEIQVKSLYMFSGYYNKPEATERKFSDGFYCSGDFGHLDDTGHLIVIDRMEDLKPLSGGRRFSPQYTEVRLRFSPYIKDVLVVGGEERDYVTAIVNIDIENVGRFAESRRIPYTTFADLSQKEQVIELIRGEIERVNQTLPDYARVRCFVNLHKEFDADEAELTRTRKIRRTFVEKRYKDIIEAMYSGRERLDVEAHVTYRDGRAGVIRTTIHINRV